MWLGRPFSRFPIFPTVYIWGFGLRMVLSKFDRARYLQMSDFGPNFLPTFPTVLSKINREILENSRFGASFVKIRP